MNCSSNKSKNTETFVELVNYESTEIFSGLHDGPQPPLSVGTGWKQHS